MNEDTLDEVGRNFAEDTMDMELERLNALLQNRNALMQQKNNQLFHGSAFDLDFEVPLTNEEKRKAMSGRISITQNVSDVKEEKIGSEEVAQKTDLPQNMPSGRGSPLSTVMSPRRVSSSKKVPGSDQLRRVAIVRRSRSFGKRQLLKEFENISINHNSNRMSFLPKISSTPTSQPLKQIDHIPLDNVQSNTAASICKKGEDLYEKSHPQSPNRTKTSSPLRITPNKGNTYTIENLPLGQVLLSPSKSQSAANATIVGISRIPEPGLESEVIVPETQNQVVYAPMVILPVSCCGHVRNSVISSSSQNAIDDKHTPECSERSKTVIADDLPGNSKIVKSDMRLIDNLNEMTDDDSDVECPLVKSSTKNNSTAPINLAPPGSNTTRELRLRNHNLQQTNTNNSKRILNLHNEKSKFTKSNEGKPALVLNKAPSAAINGEQFAKELARMSNYEILDLRKRTSLGKMLPINGHKRKSKAAIKKERLALEQGIQNELIRRNLIANDEEINNIETEKQNATQTTHPSFLDLPCIQKSQSIENNSTVGNPRMGQKLSSSCTRQTNPPMTKELEMYMTLSQPLDDRRRNSENIMRSLYTKGDSDTEAEHPIEIVPSPPSICNNSDPIEIVPQPPKSLRFSRSSRRKDSEVIPPPELYKSSNRRNTLENENLSLDKLDEVLASPPSQFLHNSRHEDLSKKPNNSMRVSSNPEHSTSSSRPRNRSENENRNMEKLNEILASPPSQFLLSSPQKRVSTNPEHSTVSSRPRNRSENENRSMEKLNEILASPPSQFLLSSPQKRVSTNPEHSTESARSRNKTVNENQNVEKVDEIIGLQIPEQASNSVGMDEPSSTTSSITLASKRSVIATSVADGTFKKPLAPAPRRKKQKKDQRVMDVSESSSSESLRRSKRGQVPLKNTWVHSQVDPFHFGFKDGIGYIKPRNERKNASRSQSRNVLTAVPLCSSTPCTQQHLHDSVGSTKTAHNFFGDTDPSTSGVTVLSEITTEVPVEPVPEKKSKSSKRRGRPKKKAEHPQTLDVISEDVQNMPLGVPQTPVSLSEDTQTADSNRVQTLSEGTQAPTTRQQNNGTETLLEENTATLLDFLRGGRNKESDNLPAGASSMMDSLRKSPVLNLRFLDVEGIGYAFYETSNEATVGYMRFPPLAKRAKKKAKEYNLFLIVHYGEFSIESSASKSGSKECCILSVGDLLEVSKGMRYEIRNTLNQVSYLQVIRNME